MISTYQIRMALAAMGWSYQDLADRANVSKMTISNLVTDKNSPNERTMRAIQNTFEMSGIEFITGGARKTEHIVKVLEGDDWFLDVVEDALQILKKGDELLIMYGDNAMTPDNVYKKLKALKKAGIQIREIICHGDTYMMNDEKYYRWIPSAMYNNKILIAYSNNIILDDGNIGYLINNPALSNIMFSTFELIWGAYPKPNKSSTAHVRY